MDNSLMGTRNRRRVYLMRHGDVVYHMPDGSRVAEPDNVDLTEWGREQARIMSGTLQDLHFDRALCTSLKRTRQTLELALGTRNMDIEERPELREIKSAGRYIMPEDNSIPPFVYAWDTAHLPGERWAGGELMAEFYARVTSGFDALLLEPGWSSMLFVAHGGVNRAILAHITGGGLEKLGAHEQETACLNVIDADIEDGKVVRTIVRLMNMTPYNLTKLGIFQTSLERGYASRRGWATDGHSIA